MNKKEIIIKIESTFGKQNSIQDVYKQCSILQEMFQRQKTINPVLPIITTSFAVMITIFNYFSISFQWEVKNMCTFPNQQLKITLLN